MCASSIEKERKSAIDRQKFYLIFLVQKKLLETSSSEKSSGKTINHLHHHYVLNVDYALKGKEIYDIVTNLC